MTTSVSASPWRIAVGLGSCGAAAGAQALYDLIDDRAGELGIDLSRTGCAGLCHREPMLELRSPTGERWTYVGLDAAGVRRILEEHVGRNRPVEELLLADRANAFLGKQKRVALENIGLIDPEVLPAYPAARLVLETMSPAAVVDLVTAAGLRGRGGAGFPTGTKWRYAAEAPGEQKYIVCNGDEGDPGAFMDRSVLESDPHRVIEGMIVGAWAIGASAGFVYVRAEYPMAVARMRLAIERARAAGILGPRVLGSSFSFDLEVREGAGAFVCGEETALIASIEGARGQPRMRPPFPARRGLWGCPTVINNVETFANVPWIMTHGAAEFAAMGTEKSKGTKVFSLVGKVRHSGLVEVPMGITLAEVVYEMGGGTSGGRPVKAVQTGGPSGGCLPASLFDTRIDYEELARHGAIMGSGGMIVMDEDTCMVDLARYFLAFTARESCGECAPCRLGTAQLLEILTRITEGRGTEEDLVTLEDLGGTIRATSLCGLGQTAPNPVLTTLRYFRHEYEEHVREKRCRAGVCRALYLAPCENSCPLHMNIPGYLQLIKENRLDEAFESVLLDNPLPSSTGRVCQQACETRCRRATVDTAVNMRDAHRFVADTLFEQLPTERVVGRLKRRKAKATGKRVAIVGAGPAGLSAAFYLALLGHAVTVHDLAAEPGGMLRYVLPQYRLPKDALDREIAVIRGLGVRFVGGTTLGRDVSLEKLRASHDAVFLAFGTWSDRGVDVPGHELPGVHSSLGFLAGVARGGRDGIGREVVVIGGGNSAIDSARTALRLGAQVTIVYRRTRDEMPAIRGEIEHALEEGAVILDQAAPVRVVEAGGRVAGLEVAETTPGAFDASGRRRPLATDRTRVIPCDTVITALGETVDAAVAAGLGLALGPAGAPAVDRTSLETSVPLVFAGGDAVNGASNVVTAMASGKRAAAAIDRRLTGRDRFAELAPAIGYDDTPPRPGTGGRRNEPRIAPPAARRANFGEVARAFTAHQARAEALRCLRCDITAAGDAE